MAQPQSQTQPQPTLDEVINKSAEKRACKEADSGFLEGVIGSVIYGGKTIAEAIHFPPEQVEFIYSYAVNLYEGGQYKDASRAFFYLEQLDHKDARYAFGYAACLHKLKVFNDAATHYLLAASVDPNNPAPWFHAADCYINLSLPHAARTMLSNAILVAGEHSQYARVKQDAAILLNVLNHANDSEKVISIESALREGGQM